MSEFKFASLGSGSKGNGTLLSFNNQLILIDCGFSARETLERFAQIGADPTQLVAILVTHEHGDHIGGVGPLARKFNVPVVASRGTLEHSKLAKVPAHKKIEVHEAHWYPIGDFNILPVAVNHDAKQPYQYLVKANLKRFGILTDLGSWSYSLVDYFSNLDALLIEANHDLNMLHRGKYPPSLKRRVGGPYGHLSNEQTANLLEELAPDGIKQLVIGHLSENNNCPEIVRETLASSFSKAQTYALLEQSTPSNWFDIC